MEDKMKPHNFGKRLNLARKKAGLTYRGLSEILEGAVSHTALSRYEKNEMFPSSTVLISLSKALKVPMDFFFRSDPIGDLTVDFRKHSKLSKTDEAKIQSTVQDTLERYIEAAEASGVDFTYGLPQISVTLQNDAIYAAEEVRKVLNLGFAPISDLTAVLEDASIVVAFEECHEKFVGICLYNDNSAAIAINSSFDSCRKRFTLAHELGHLVMKFDDSLTEREHEKFCHIFASAFLLPPNVLKDSVGHHRTSMYFEELYPIKEEFGISIQAIGALLAQLSIISQSSYKKFNIVIRKKGWYKNEPGKYLGIEEPQLLRRLTLRALALESISVSKAAAILNMPQSEIMKMEKAL